MEPPFRFGTSKAIEELAAELNLPPNMEDWSYMVSKPNDIDKYISHYLLTVDEKKKCFNENDITSNYKL